MDTQHLQILRNLKQKLFSRFVKIIDICPQLNISTDQPILIFRHVDEAFRKIYKSSDDNIRLKYVTEFLNNDFQEILKWKDTVFPVFHESSKNIKTELEKILKQNNLYNDETKEKLNGLSPLDDPFSNISQKPFNFKNYLQYLPIDAIHSSIFDHVKNLSYIYKLFFIFLHDINWISLYKEQIDNNKIPDYSFYNPEKNRLNLASSKDSSLVISLREESNLPRVIHMDSSNEMKNWGMIKIESDPLLHQNEEKPSKEARHHGLLSLGGLIFPQNKRVQRNNQLPKTLDNDTQFLNKYNKFVMNLNDEEEGRKMSNSERVQARMEQKVMLLQHESQILRDNLYIIKRQKEEMIQAYENFIKEVIRQNEALTVENDQIKIKKRNEI